MRAAECLLGIFLLAGLSVSNADQYAFQVGKTYTYAARGRLMAGITEISTQYSGMEMEYLINIAVIGRNTLILTPSGFKVSDLNTVLEGGWRDGQLKDQARVDLSFRIREYLESPIEVKYEHGIVTAIKVQGNLPTYAVNMKKAQVSYFVLDSAGQNLILPGNLNHVRPKDEHVHSDSGVFYETMEHTVLGHCGTYYTVSQTGPFPDQRRGTDALKEDLDEERSDEQPPDSDSQEGINVAEVRNQQSSEASINEEGQRKSQKYKAYKDMVRRNHEDFASAVESGYAVGGDILTPQTFHRFCDGQAQLYEIIKTVNYTNCKNKPVLGFVSTPHFLNSRPGDNNVGSGINRIAYSRYIACGRDRKHLTILQIEQEEQLYIGLHKTEKTFGGTVKNLTLTNILRITRIPAAPLNPKLITDLTYAFDPKEQQLRHEGELQTPFDSTNMNSNDVDQNLGRGSDQGHNSQYQTEPERQGPLAQPDLMKPPLNPMLVSPLNVLGMKRRFGFLLAGIVEDLMSKKPLAEAETVSKISTLAKILRFLGYWDIEELYNKFAGKNQLPEDNISRNVVLDAMAMAGTNPNIKFLIDLISTNSVTGEQAAQLLMTFPTYIHTPTKKLLDYFFHQVDGTAGTKASADAVDQVKTTAILAFSNLVYDACVNSHHMSSRYPVALYGEFCNPKIVERDYLKPLLRDLKLWLEQINSNQNFLSARHWFTVYLTALGNIGHPAIIPEIQLLLETVTDPYIKTKVVFALKRLVVPRSARNLSPLTLTAVDHSEPDVLTAEIVEQKVLPLLASVAFDKTEFPGVRMAAISLLIRTPSTDFAIWQQLAYSTWFETSAEVHSFIYTTLKSLTGVKRSLAKASWIAQVNARTVLPLAKPIPGDLAKSRTAFESDYDEESQSAYMYHWSHFGSKDSILPHGFHFKNFVSYANGELGSSPMEISLHSDSIQQLILHLMGKFDRPSGAHLEGNDAIKQIMHLLNIADRDENDEPQADLQLKLYSRMERIFSVNQETIDQFIEQLKKSYIPQLVNGMPFNYQKTLQTHSISVEVPTIFGIPATIDFHSTVLTSLRGNVKVLNENGLRDVQLQLEVHPILAKKYVTSIQFKSTFTGRKYQGGNQRHFVVEAPFRALLRKANTGHFEFAITPGHLRERSPSGVIQLVTFHRRPYTATIFDELWPACHKAGGDFKIVHALETSFKESRKFGDEALGMSFRLEQITEFHPQRDDFYVWARNFQRFGSLGKFLNLEAYEDSTLRLAERKLILDVSESKTKTVFFAVTGKLQTYFQDVHQRQQKQTSEEREEPRNSRPYMPMPVNEDSLNSNLSLEQTLDEEESQNSVESSEEQHQHAVSDEPPPEFVLAMIGKSTPIQSPLASPGIQKHLGNTNISSTVQYLFSYSNSPGQDFVRFSAGEATKEAALQLPQDSEAMQAIRQAVLNSPLANQQASACVEYNGKYEFPQFAGHKKLLVLRQRLLQEHLKVGVKGRLSFGHSCDSLAHNITLQGEVYRDEQMTEFSRSKSLEAKKCNADERKGFFSSPVCIWASEQQAAALNSGTFEIRSTRLPLRFINATIQAREFLKAQFYEYMSLNPFPALDSSRSNENSSVTAQFTLTPDQKFLTLRLFGHESSLFFENIRLKEVARTMIPVTVTQSLARNIRDRVFHTDSQASCSIESKFVSTFDNVKYEFNSSLTPDCYHVLAQDCSGRHAVSVLAKELGNKVLSTTVLLPSNFRIDLRPALRRVSTEEGSTPASSRVRVNNAPVDVLPTVVRDKTGSFIARIEEGADGGLQLFSRRVQVTTNGRHIVIFATNALRNATCGLCGNFDGEKNMELRSPKNCPLSSGSLLMASYAVQSPNAQQPAQCTVDPDILKAIKDEERDCEAQSLLLQNPTPRLSAAVTCQEKVIDVVESIVYRAVYRAAKTVPGLNEKKLAKESETLVRDLLSREWKADRIGEVVAAAVARYVPLVGRKLRPTIKADVAKAVELICTRTGCCEAQAQHEPRAERSKQ